MSVTMAKKPQKPGKVSERLRSLRFRPGDDILPIIEKLRDGRTQQAWLDRVVRYFIRTQGNHPEIPEVDPEEA